MRKKRRKLFEEGKGGNYSKKEKEEIIGRRKRRKLFEEGKGGNYSKREKVEIIQRRKLMVTPTNRPTG